MATLDLDFHRPPPASPLGWVVLLLGLAAFAALFAIHRQLQAEASALSAKAAALEARLPRPAARKDREADEALAAARRALDKARLPWERLFGSLEAADNGDVALLAVVPDGPRGQVKLHAEARNLAAMVAYQRRLEQAGGLHQVTLVDHESAGDPVSAPVRFHISAAWGENRGRP